MCCCSLLRLWGGASSDCVQHNRLSGFQGSAVWEAMEKDGLWRLKNELRPLFAPKMSVVDEFIL